MCSFLFVRLAMELLRLLSLTEEITAGDFTPQNLEDAYYQLLRALIDFRDLILFELQLFEPVAKLVTNAVRPMKLMEIKDALSQDGKVDPALSMDNIGVISCGLIDVEKETSIVFLTHHTTDEYLQRNSSYWWPNGEREIAETCIAYLLSNEFQSGPCRSDEERIDRWDRHPFHRYAAENWGNHSRAHYKELEPLILTLLRSKGELEAASETLLHYDWDTPFQVATPALQGLHIAAHFGLVEAILELSRQGYDPNAVDCTGRTPLFWATESGHAPAVKALLDEGVPVEQKEPRNGFTPLSLAAARQHLQVADILLKAGAADPDTAARGSMAPLHFATREADGEMAKVLLSHGANINSTTETGETGLLIAAKNGSRDLVALLLNAGALTAIADDSGQTPLHWAAQGGDEEITKLLLDAGADKDCLDDQGFTPLLRAVRCKHEGVVKLLLEAGASIAANDSFTETPLISAVRGGNHGMVRILLEGGANIEASISLGLAPLTLAVESGDHRMVEILLNRGANIEARDGRGQTPLIFAASRGHGMIVKALLDAGADIEAKGRDGQSPLACAAGAGFEEVAKVLLSRGANVNATDAESRTPWMTAQQNGYTKLGEFIRLYSPDDAVDDGDSKERIPAA